VLTLLLLSLLLSHSLIEELKIGSRKFRKSYSQLLLDEDDTGSGTHEDQTTNPFLHSLKENRKSVIKPSPTRNSFRTDLERKLPVTDPDHVSPDSSRHSGAGYLQTNLSPKQSDFKKSPAKNSSSSQFSTSATVGLAKLKLLKRLQPKEPSPREVEVHKNSIKETRSSFSSTVPNEELRPRTSITKVTNH
jgi:hypothetical protein